MKVLQVPFTFRPDPIGGTEVYVESLAVELMARYAVSSTICAPAAQSSRYAIKEIPVERFAVQGEDFAADYTYGPGDAIAAANFAAILDRERPDIVHMHALTPAVSLRVAQEIKQRNLPLAFTYHTPTVTCQRGTLMRWGTTPCDGRMRVARCAACTVHAHGIPRPAADVVGHVPVGLGGVLERRGLAGGAWTALRMPRLMQMRHGVVRGVLDLADAIVAPSQWVIDLLAVNGIAPGKIVFSRQGLPAHALPGTRPEKQSGTLRVAFFGRLHAMKGIDVLVEALRVIPDTALVLDIYAITESGPPSSYERMLRAAAARDSRIRFRDPVASDAVVEVMSGYDLVAIPSQWFETGPLVLLEAFAAGTPVIASDLGGIAERVERGRDGVLVPPRDARKWGNALAHLAAHPAELEALRRNVKRPRTMGDVAADMQGLYSRLA